MTASNLLANGTTYAAENNSSASSESTSNCTNNITRCAADPTSHESKNFNRCVKKLTRHVTENNFIPDEDRNSASTSTKIVAAKIPTILAKKSATKSDVWDHFKVLIDDRSDKTHECLHCAQDYSNFELYCIRDQTGSFETT